MNNRLNKVLNLDVAAHVSDKNFLSSVMLQKDQEIVKMMDEIRDLNQKNEKLVLQVKS